MKNPPKGVCAAVLLFAAASAALAAPQKSTSETFTIAAGGDLIGPFHPIDWSDPSFQRVASLFQQADVGFANAEVSIFDLSTFKGYPAAETGGGYPVQKSEAARNIRRMGIGLVGKANNHAADWGAEGLVATLHSLAAAAIIEAGAGLSASEARTAAYTTTGHGTVALVDAASTFTPMSVAGASVERQGLASLPRPGINALHIRDVRFVTPQDLETIRRAAGAAETADGTVRVSDQIFRASTAPGFGREMDPADEGTVLHSVRDAKQNAEFVIFSIHAHETAGDDDTPGPAAFEPMVLHKADEAPSPNDPRPANFETELFHAAIDAGADLVVRTGPHVIGGIEIYKNRPIFYSLGSLFCDFGGDRVLTTPGGERLVVPDSWFESYVPVSTFRRGKPYEIRLYPIMIESRAGAAGGMPRLAEAEAADRILSRLKTLSSAFGTVISIGNGIGIIRFANH